MASANKRTGFGYPNIHLFDSSGRRKSFPETILAQDKERIAHAIDEIYLHNKAHFAYHSVSRMDEPREELKTDDDERAEAPDFDALSPPAEVVRGGRTRDDFFDAVLGLDSPATAGEVADLAGHGVDAAREYLEWFERLGIVTRVTDSPATYERNREYLDWRRVQKLRQKYTTEELLNFLKVESERQGALLREFGAEYPTEVSVAHYAAETDQSIEVVWKRLTTWKKVRRRVELLERALTEIEERQRSSWVE